MRIFEQLESNVRSYSRVFPAIFKKAQGSTLEDRDGKQYIDFLSGVGALNYGHNNLQIKQRLIDYLQADGIVHGLDMATVAKEEFLQTFETLILKPQKFHYKIQFPGPTGTNAVEAALKLARNITGRQNIVAFSGGFHGVTLGSVATTASVFQRSAAGTAPTGVTFMPYDGYLGPGIDTTEYLDKALSDSGSGLMPPAAVLLETIQGSGGVNVASVEWLRALQRVCRKHDILLIVDDIQVGCGRTGTFLSFEAAGISPDMVILSKSLSGFGLPFALVLIKPEVDQWKPGQHSGTFRGPNLAFVTAKAALELYWQDDALTKAIDRKGNVVQQRLKQIAQSLNQNLDPNADPNPGTSHFSVRGRGLMQGLDCNDGTLAKSIQKAAFANHLVLETAGSRGQVIRCLPALTISDELLEEGLTVLEKTIYQTIDAHKV